MVVGVSVGMSGSGSEVWTGRGHHGRFRDVATWAGVRHRGERKVVVGADHRSARETGVEAMGVDMCECESCEAEGREVGRT